MQKYWIEVTFIVEVEAESEEEAEDIGWDWLAPHPQPTDFYMAEKVSPETVNVQ